MTSIVRTCSVPIGLDAFSGIGINVGNGFFTNMFIGFSMRELKKGSGFFVQEIVIQLVKGKLCIR